MCERCVGGSLGYGPGGARAFCTCVEGIRAALEESSQLLSFYAEQLAVFDRHADLPPKMRAMRDTIQDAYNLECLVHDQLEARLEGMR